MADAAITELVLRIENALKSEIGGHEAAKMAWSYAEFVSRVNQELVECADLFGDGKVLEAFIALRSKPLLLQRIEALKFSSRKGWDECCTFFGWRKAGPLKENLANFLTESLEDISDPKDLLVSAFRASQRVSDPLASLRVLQLLCSEYPKENDYRIELNRIRDRCRENAELELKKIGDIDRNRTAAKALIDRYLSNGFSLEDAGDRFVEAEVAIRTHEANERVRDFLDESASYETGDDWYAYERAFFVCDSVLDLTDTHDRIEPEYKRALGEMSSRLYSLRGSYEVNLQVRNALAMSAGKKRQKKLERLLAHANVMGYQIDDALKNDLSSIGNQDREEGGSKLIAFFGVCVPLLIVSGWVYNAVVLHVPKPAKPEAVTPLVVESPKKAKSKKGEQSKGETSEAIVEYETKREIAPIVKKVPQPVPTPVEIVKAEPPVDRAYLALLDDFRELIATEYTVESDARFERIQAESKQFAGVDQENYRDVAIEFAALAIQFELKKEERIKELVTLADFAVLAAKRMAESLESSSSEREMRTQIAIVSKAIDDAYRAIHQATEVKPDYLIDGLEIVEDQLDEAKDSMEFLASLREELMNCRSLESYYSLLGGLEEFHFVAQDEKDAIALALRNRLDLDDSLKRLVMPDRESEWEELGKHEDYLNSSIMPTSDEVSKLMEFSHEPFFSNVYVSKFRYYQGGYEPQGERLVYLSAPIVQIGEESGGTANITFKEYSFDDDGKPHLKPRNLNYIKRESGEIFGFYYEPSELSPESQYFVSVVKDALDESVSGASRSNLVELLQTISNERSLPPILKAYWALSIFEIIDADAFKWLEAFSPTLVRFSTLAKQLASTEEVSRHAWLSVDERRMPSATWTNYFNEFSESDPLSEIKAFAHLYSAARQGSLNQVGFAKMDGAIHFIDTAKSYDGKLWAFDLESKSLKQIEKDERLTPYSVVVAFEYEGQGVATIKEKVQADFGIDVDHVRFEELLPPLFK